MGARKRIRAEQMKEAKKATYVARLNDCPTSPRKMRLMADLIRGMNAEKAVAVLKISPKESSQPLMKLLLSAINNWQNKNDGQRMEDAALYIKTINVDSGRVLKRILPAPQGRAHRIRKGSNHVTLTLGSRTEEANTVDNQ